jgi:hypothetical protein
MAWKFLKFTIQMLGQVLLHSFYKRPEKVIQFSDDDRISVTCVKVAEMMKTYITKLFQFEFKIW